MAHCNCARRPHRLAQRSDGLINGLPLHPQRTSTTLAWRILPCAASLTARQQQRSHGGGRAALNSRRTAHLVRSNQAECDRIAQRSGACFGSDRGQLPCPPTDGASDTHTNDFAATVDSSFPKRDRRLGVSGGCVTGGPYASHPALQAPLQYRGAP